MTYREARRYLDSLANYETSGVVRRRYYNLARIRRLSSFFGDPHTAFNAVHIAGTKGKGSTASYVASILKEAGFKTGLYTSPHICSERERIRINGRLISEEDLARHLSRIKATLERARPRLKPSYFEVFTQIAFNYFREKRVDLAVFEVGMGGRLDATNIIKPLVAGITPVSIEHVEFLGKDLISIAKEKSAIIKRGCACVSSPQEAGALRVIRRRCASLGVPLYIVGRHIKSKEVVHSLKDEIFDIKGLSGTYRNCVSPLLGYHQILNCDQAIGIVECLGKKGFKIPEAAVRKGVKNVSWPGRFEIARKKPYVIMDGAQNPASARVLREALRRNLSFRKLIAVLGFSSDKDMAGVARELSGITDIFILTNADTPRAASPEVIEKRIKGVKADIIKAPGVKNAYRKALDMAGPEDAVLVTGSFYVIGELKKYLKKVNSKLKTQSSKLQLKT